jgi:hypothetical protein
MRAIDRHGDEHNEKAGREAGISAEVQIACILCDATALR